MERYEDKQWQDSMRLRIDYNNMMSKYVGKRGISDASLRGLKKSCEKAAQAIKENRESMKWRELPYNQA